MFELHQKTLVYSDKVALTDAHIFSSMRTVLSKFTDFDFDISSWKPSLCCQVLYLQFQVFIFDALEFVEVDSYKRENFSVDDCCHHYQNLKEKIKILSSDLHNSQVPINNWNCTDQKEETIDSEIE